MAKTKNYIQVPCYLNVEQNNRLKKLQYSLYTEYKFKIPITELIRDSVVQFLEKMTPEITEKYMEEKIGCNYRYGM